MAKMESSKGFETASRNSRGEAYQPALERAALEAFEGQYDESWISNKIDKEKIRKPFQEIPHPLDNHELCMSKKEHERVRTALEE